ncbi:hypothetical protein AMTR_s00141p00103410 [Amborella trichopoda]|uniref:Uncharacterized protein n=1 Tax=Amborella trichopoda TaxID=13333 RepID=W1PAT7_AMBTC|nr:hypothetical protein AMTR_s00141p00103410 [Amborella trichopoda]
MNTWVQDVKFMSYQPVVRTLFLLRGEGAIEGNVMLHFTLYSANGVACTSMWFVQRKVERVEVRANPLGYNSKASPTHAYSVATLTCKLLA